MDNIKILFPVIVEGKYDKIALDAVIDAHIITTDGFGIFKNSEKKALIRRLSEKGIIVMCDSDGAGKIIRRHLSGIVPKEKLYQLYVPQIRGKEKRKAKASAEGFLGVEGVGADILRETVEKFVTLHPEAAGDERIRAEAITKLDFYEVGLSGGSNASAMRDAVAEETGLPHGMSANALLAALNLIITREDFNDICKKISEK